MKIEEVIKSEHMPLELKTVLNLLYTANLLQDKTAEILKPYDLSAEQFNVLRILRGQKGVPASLGCVQERMLTKMSNTTRLIDKLLKKEMVQRSICETNRRKIDLVITQKGLDTLKELDTPMNELNRRVVQNLSTKQALLLNDMLDKIRE